MSAALKLYCLEHDLNLWMKTESVTVRAHATVSMSGFWAEYMETNTRHIPLHPFQLGPAWFYGFMRRSGFLFMTVYSLVPQSHMWLCSNQWEGSTGWGWAFTVRSHVTLFQPMRGEYWVRVSIYGKVTCDSVPTNERGVLGEGEHLR